MKIIAYYTPDNYKKDAERFEASLIKAGMDYYIKELDYKDDWHKANQYKPRFIQECRDMFSDKLLYVDVDAVVHGNCDDYFENLDCDFGVHWFQGPYVGYSRVNNNVLLGGTLFFNDTISANLLLKYWVKVNDSTFKEGTAHRGDQTSLATIVEGDWIPDLKTENILGRYCYVFDKPWAYPKNEPRIIEHLIASRENKDASKGKINAPRQKRLEELDNDS